jgi:putative endonuclease
MSYYVYILSSRSRNLYTGVTNDIFRRVWQHRGGRGAEFTRRYRIHRLVCFERFDSVHSAIAREKQIKAWIRAKRIALIESQNPAWDDLAARWYEAGAKQRAEQERADPSLRSG